MRAYLKLYWLGRLSQHWTCLYFIVCANVVVAGIFNFIMQVIFTGFWNHSYKRLVTWNTQWTDFNRLNVIVNCLLKCYYAKAHFLEECNETILFLFFQMIYLYWRNMTSHLDLLKSECHQTLESAPQLENPQNCSFQFCFINGLLNVS